MNEHTKSRREFLVTVGAAGAASILAGSDATGRSLAAESEQKLAVDGGTPVRKTALHYKPYGPQFYDDVEKQELIEVLESRLPFRWRGKESKALQFEQAYAAHIGAKYAIGVTSGTTALYTAMAALEIGPGDEVILPAWTWYADYDAVVMDGVGHYLHMTRPQEFNPLLLRAIDELTRAAAVPPAAGHIGQDPSAANR